MAHDTRDRGTPSERMGSNGGQYPNRNWKSSSHQFKDRTNFDYSGLFSPTMERASSRRQSISRRPNAYVNALLNSTIVYRPLNQNGEEYQKDRSKFTFSKEYTPEDGVYTSKGIAMRKNAYQRNDNPMEQLECIRDTLFRITDDEGFITQDTLKATFDVSNEFITNFSSEYAAERNNRFIESGKIDSKIILMDACRTMDISVDEKVKFAFDLFDTQKIGVLYRHQVVQLVESLCSRQNLEVIGMTYEILVDLLFQKVQSNVTTPYDYISFNQFKRVFQSYVEEADREDKQMIKELPAPNDKSCKGRIAEYYFQNELRIWWVFLYLISNVLCFAIRVSWYSYDPVVGYGIHIARGSAQLILWNLLLILIPISRTIVGVLRMNNFIWKYIPFDDNVEFHKLVGCVFSFFCIVHSFAHIYNAKLLMDATEDQVKESVYYRKTTMVPNGKLLQFWELLSLLPIWTGVVLLIILIIAFPLAAIPKLRQGHFNWFWFSHLLFIPFTIILIFHGASQWLAPTTAFIWILPIFFICLIERRYRFTKSFKRPINILSAERHQNTLALYLSKPAKFEYNPGMYIYINVPKLSSFEWHPFTISSAPDDDYISVHINNSGDWTGSLHQLITDIQMSGKEYPVVYIDGPVGAPAQDFHRYSVIVMICGGIGVTPFASILKNFLYLWDNSRCEKCDHINHPRDLKAKKIYFHWVTRGQKSFGWFPETMNQLAKMDVDQRLEIHHYLSSIKDEVEISCPLKMFQTFVHDETGKDFISGLMMNSVTHFGRPNWDLIFSNLAENHQRHDIGVFFCGNYKLGKTLEKVCRTYTNEKTKTFFDFHSENFN